MTVMGLGNIATSPDQPKIIAYFEPTQDGLQFDDLDASTLTHLIYAFATIDLEGTISWIGPGKSGTAFEFWAESRRMAKYERYCGCEGDCLKGYLNQLWKLKRENPHLRTIMSVGGYAWSANFSAVMKDPIKRNNAVVTGTKMMLDYGFDGIDIDWEFPADFDRSKAETEFTSDPNDWLNFAQLMTDYRAYWKAQSLPDDLLLTIAGPGFMDESRGLKASLYSLSKTLSFVLVMAYEYQHSPEIVRLGAQLYMRPGDTGAENSTNVEKIMSDLSMFFDKKQLIAGIPVYASGFQGFKKGTGNRDMPCLGDDARTAEEAPKISYKEAMIQASTHYKGYTVSLSRGQAVICDNRTQYSFDSPETVVQKAKFVKDKGYGGVMFWDLSQDISPKKNPEYSLAVAAKNAFGFNSKVSSNRTFNDLCIDQSKFCNLRCSYTPEIANAYIEKNSGNRFGYSILILILVFFQ